ncbi:MAG: radical SAM protein, partial [Vicinamibacterales bacterium]
MASALRLEPDPPATSLSVMLTRRCNMTCGHCSVESAPGIRGEPTEDELLEWVRASAAAGLRAIRLTGGEPMLRPAIVLNLLRECRRLGLSTSMTSNGFWGRTRAQARKQVRALLRAGLDSLVVSYDRYHAEFMGPEPVQHITNAAEALGLPLRITLVRGTDEPELTEVIGKLDGAASARIRIYDLQPVGRARELPMTLHRAEVEGFCTACSFPALTDDGRLVACNGPSYFEPAGSPLVLGSVRDTPVAELIDRHRSDPVLDTIRTTGPSGLRRELRQIPGFESFPFRAAYSGICDLCQHITRDADAVAALREHLARPQSAALRLARWRVIEGSRRRGVLSPSYVNGVGAARLFLAAAWEGRLDAEAEQVLGRADFDWRHSLAYLSGCGLARPLTGVLDAPALTRWVPQFHRDGV